MNILVCVKQTPSGNVPFDRENFTLNRDKAELCLNPPDACAFENALRLKERFDAEITVISMGKPGAATMLRSLSAIGGDRFYLISDPVFAGADTYATASVLSRAVEYLGGFDLIICGERAIDGETGQVGPELSALLGYSFAGYITEFEKVTPDTMECVQMDGKGTYALPAVATVRKNCVLRCPGISGLKSAKNRSIPVLAAADLGGAAESLTKVIRMSRKEVKKRKAIWYSDDEDGIRGLMEELDFKISTAPLL